MTPNNNDNYNVFRGIGFDPAVGLALLTAVAILLLYTSPFLSRGDLEYFSEMGVPVAIGITLFSLFHGLNRISHSEERWFWLSIATAVACWLTGQLVYFLKLPSPRAEYLYLVYYIAVLIAIDLRPHLKTGWAEDRPRSVFATAGTLILTAGLLTYFVAVPSIWTPGSSGVLYQHYIYMFLDTVVAVRFFRRYRSCRSTRWGMLYGLLTLTSAFILAQDLRDFLYYADIVPVPAGGWLDILYYLPHATLITATRLRNISPLRRLQQSQRCSNEPRRGPPGLLWGYALYLPTLHLLLSYLGLLEVTYRTELDLTVLFFSLVLTTLAIAQLRFAERKKGRLTSRLEVLTRNEQTLHLEKISALRRFSSGIAHQFNNLFQVIIGYGQMLLGRPETDWQQRGQIRKMLEASNQASQLTEQLLAYSKTLVIRPHLFDLNALLDQQYNRLQQIVGSDVVFRRALAPDNVWIMCDSNALVHALTKLATFARELMPQGGELSLATGIVEIEEQSTRPHCVLEPGHYAEISLRMGARVVEDKDLRMVFEPFALDSCPGGLALPAAQGIINQSQGYITASNEPGPGTTFEIFFLLAAPPPAEAAKPVANSIAAVSQSRTVLLVDDDEELREMLREYLRGAGFHVVEAGNGERALEVCQQYGAPIDLLLTDVVMPEMGGFELARQVSMDYPDMKILFMSGRIPGDSMEYNVANWKARFLNKPFALRDLRRKLKEVLGPVQQDDPPEDTDH